MATARSTDKTIPALTTPLQVEIPPLAPGELERMSVEYALSRETRLREVLVLHHQRLVRSIASRFMGAGESLEDLIQVGNIGLINALDRYNPSQGTRFSTYATPTILGEIKRHFRDKTSGIKMPRWLQELQQATRRATQALTPELGRSPTVSELAEFLQLTEEEVAEAMESREALNLLSLDTHLDGHSAADSTSLLDLIGRKDKTLLEFENFGDLRNALESLNPREREVISLRFFDDMSQAKIASKLNISQMHVSRLQQRALKRLREMLTEDVRVLAGRRPRSEKRP
ncbi:MAG: SigB/SigF/SigG family RNA polymerase sigma factor [Cytophagales bacterium]|nr:SigB/SigF/SigG family RNA polymerase sigma factor [Armatimonadota bacterium]